MAALINLGVARVLLAAGRRHESITLEADGHHLMADVWTSLGVIVGVAAAVLSGWHRLDAVVGIVVALQVLRSGYKLVRRSLLGLLDTSLPQSTLDTITGILDRHAPDGVRYHALRTRQAGAMRFISFHILVPGRWTVQRGHDLLEQIEERIRDAVPNSVVDTHLEPIEDPVSWEDTRLERPSNGGSHRAGLSRAGRLLQPHLHLPDPLLAGCQRLGQPPLLDRIVQPVGGADAGLQTQVVVGRAAGRRPSAAVDPDPHLRHLGRIGPAG